MVQTLSTPSIRLSVTHAVVNCAHEALQRRGSVCIIYTHVCTNHFRQALGRRIMASRRAARYSVEGVGERTEDDQSMSWGRGARDRGRRETSKVVAYTIGSGNKLCVSIDKLYKLVCIIYGVSDVSGPR